MSLTDSPVLEDVDLVIPLKVLKILSSLSVYSDEGEIILATSGRCVVSEW